MSHLPTDIAPPVIPGQRATPKRTAMAERRLPTLKPPNGAGRQLCFARAVSPGRRGRAPSTLVSIRSV